MNPVDNEKHVSHRRKRIMQFCTAKFCKTIFISAMYLVASVIVIRDCIVIIMKTVAPEFVKDSAPYLLDKLLDLLVSLATL